MTPHHVCASIFFAAIFAEAQISPNWWEPLVSSGPLGVVLLWFMLRSEKKTGAQTEAINNMVLMLAAVILALKHADAAIVELTARCKEQADRLAKHENSSG